MDIDGKTLEKQRTKDVYVCMYMCALAVHFVVQATRELYVLWIWAIKKQAVKI